MSRRTRKRFAKQQAAATSNGHSSGHSTPPPRHVTLAPAGGFRHGGVTYREGQPVPDRYARALREGELASLDPARGIPDAPPNFSRSVIPQAITFMSKTSTIANIYRNPDVAYQKSPENARIMRNDTSIMECVESRKRGVALLGYHLDAEDADNPQQKKLCLDLMDILAEIPEFTEYRSNMLDATWFGRHANQHTYGFEQIKSKRRCVINRWQPINGDKLVFRYDDGTGKYSGNEVGIKVGQIWGTRDAIAGNRKIEFTDQGPCYFLEPWERSSIAIHKHIIEDGVYEDATSAGRIHGVGIRDRIYWCWFQKQETMAHLMEVIERTGTGFTIYYYPAGDDRAKQAVEQVAKNSQYQNVILFPRIPGDPATDAYGIERIEPSTQGITALKEIIHEFFGWQIKRYILGQILSSESAATGLGSGVAMLHQDTFLQIIQYDAVKLEETLTRELLRPLIDLNFPWARGIKIRFKIDTESNDAEKKLAAVKTAWDIGLKLKAADVYKMVGMGKPDADDEVLANPAMGPALAGAGGMPGGPGQVDENGEPIQPGAGSGDSQPGTLEDSFGSLAKELGGGKQNPGSEDPGNDWQGGSDGKSPSPGGTPGGPRRYAATAPAAPGNQSRWKTHHQPGDTKTENGVTYRLNEHHRWELADKSQAAVHEAATETAEFGEKPAASTPGGQIPWTGPDPTGGRKSTPEEEEANTRRAYGLGDKIPKDGPASGRNPAADDHATRHAFVSSKLAGVDPQAASVIQSFHATPEYQSGAEVANQSMEAVHAGKLRNWLTSSAMKGDGPPMILPNGQQGATSKVAGGLAVDLGEGKVGFCGEAGSFVVWPAGADGKQRVSYTSKTGIVSRAAGGGDPLKNNAKNFNPQSDIKTGANQNGQQSPGAAPQGNQGAAGVAGANQAPAPTATPQVGQQPIPQQKPWTGPDPTGGRQQSPEEQDANTRRAYGLGDAVQPGGGNPTLPAGNPTSSPETATPAGNPAGDSPFTTPAPDANPHRQNADAAHAGWMDAVKGMDAASKNGADAKQLAAWGKHVRSRRQIFREFDQAAKHHDKQQAKAGNAGSGGKPTEPSTPGGTSPAATGGAAGGPTGGLSDDDKQKLRSLGLDPDKLGGQLQEYRPDATVDPRRPKLGSPEDKALAERESKERAAMAAKGIDPSKPFTTKTEHLKNQAAALAGGNALPGVGKGPATANPEPAAEVTHGIGPRAIPGSEGDSVPKETGQKELPMDNVPAETVQKSDDAVIPAAPAKPPKNPDEWKSHVSRLLADHGLHGHEKNIAAVQSAIDAGEVKSPAELKRVLAAAAKSHQKGDVNLNSHDHLKTALSRKANRKPARSYDSTVKEQAAAWDMSPDDYRSLADDMWSDYSSHHGERESAKDAARKSTGLTAADINRLENQGLDHASDHPRIRAARFDEVAGELAGQYPSLGWFSTGDKGGVNEDHSEKLWNLIREGKGEVPSKASEDFHNHIDEFLRSSSRSAGSSSGPTMTDEERAAIPFSARWGEMRNGYRKWLYGKKAKSSPGQVGMFDESKHPRGMPENAGEFAPKDAAAASPAPLAEKSTEPFSLENKTPRGKGEEFQNLGGKQNKMWHGMDDLPGQTSMFEGLDLAGPPAEVKKNRDAFAEAMGKEDNGGMDIEKIAADVESGKISRSSVRKQHGDDVYFAVNAHLKEKREAAESIPFVPSEEDKAAEAKAAEIAAREQEERDAEDNAKLSKKRESAEKDDKERRSESHVAASLKQRAEIAKQEIDRTKDREEKRLYKADLQMPDAHDAMLKAGWKFEYQSKSGSLYYRKGEQKARLADHAVPATAEREHSKGQGGFTWADSDSEIILPVDDVSAEVKSLSSGDSPAKYRKLSPTELRSSIASPASETESDSPTLAEHESSESDI